MLLERTKSFARDNFHSLAHSDYRYFFFGQLISLVGTWMQVMAQAWLVYTITNSAFKLGVVSAVQFLPTLLFSLLAGVLIDKGSKKKILIATQIMSMLQAFALFALVYLDAVQYWHVLLLAFILGCNNSIDMPARQSYVMHLVGRKDVVNAVGLNSAAFNLARVVGPAIAGILMTGIGIEWCFFLNGLSFIVVIIGLLLIQQHGRSVATDKKEHILDEIKDGLLYVYRTPALFKTTLMVLFVTVVGFNYNVLIPVFAKTILGLKEQGFGLLLSFFGVGSLIGALISSMRFKKKEPRPRLLIASALFVGTGLFFMGFASNMYTAAFLISMCGVFGIWFFTMANSILQLNSEDKYRGRVMSVYTIVFAGSMPIGNFITGFVAQQVGANITFISMGIIIVFVILVTQFIRAHW